MNEIEINAFGIEVTRKCNMQCDFCMRGKSQNIEITSDVMNNIFDSLSKFEKISIGTINLTGGEPFLAPEKVVKIINELMKRNINISWLTITTNGSIFDENIIHALNLMNEYAKFGVTLRISADPHHIINKDKLNTNIEKIKEVFKGKLEIQVDVPFLLPSGYENNNNTPPKYNEFISYYDGEKVYVPLLFITSKGTITDTCDYSYEQVDKFNFGSIDKITLDDSFMKSVIHKTKIGEQLNFGIPKAKEIDNMNSANNIENEQDIFVEQTNPFNANGPVYAFTNEALNQFMSNYDFNGKSILASLGSGDFALNAYLLGASKIENFDINQYTYYFYQLKKALIMKYTYEEFCNLIINPTSIFKKFDEYKQLLDNNTRNFFEKLLKIYGNDYKALLSKMYIDKIEEKNKWNESNTFDSTEELFLIAQYKNYYLQSANNYNSLKNKLVNNPHDTFYFKNLYQFTPPKKYDIVYLSNIGDYCKSEEEFKNFVESIKSSYLNENGIIIIVSITNHILMSGNEATRTKMNWNDMENFNNTHKGIARLPISNLGIQNVYTTYPFQTKNQYHKR